MDAKITKKRLSRLLSYDWLKIVGVAAAFIVVWSLLFTMTATRITPAQQFTVFNHYANVAFDYSSFYGDLDRALDNGVFSYEVMEVDAIDLATAGEERYTMCDTRFTTGQGDMMFIPNIQDAEFAEKDVQITYVESFFGRYEPYMVSWDEYLASAHTYLNEYFNGDYQTGELNVAKAEKDFRARAKQNKDKRFKKESKIQQGVKDECARLEKYRSELIKFEGYLAEGIIRLENVVYKNHSSGEAYIDETTGEVYLQGRYALNLCPSEEKTGGLQNQVYYSVASEDGTRKASAKDMCVVLFSLPEMDKDFQYETVAYLNTVIASAIAATQA